MGRMLRAKSVTSHPLYGAWTKWKRSSPAFVRLDHAVARWRERHLGRIALELNPITGEGVVRAVVGGTPSLVWPFAVGEIVYGYRSALDHLYFRLVIAKHGKTPAAKIEELAQFPIIYKIGSAFDRKKTGQFVNEPVVDWLEQVQPDKGPKFEPLRDLALLSNYDKHRRLVLVSGGIIESNITVDELTDCWLVRAPEPFSGPVVDGNEITHFQIERTGPKPNARVNGRFASDVVFGKDTPLAGKPVVRTLYWIRGAVSEVLLGAEQFFPAWGPHPRLKVPRRSP